MIGVDFGNVYDSIEKYKDAKFEYANFQDIGLSTIILARFCEVF